MLRGFLASPWINVVAAIVGGVLFGFGLGTLPRGFSVLSAVWTVLGLILLWWAIMDRRKTRPGTPESEADGSHTIE
ncbi:MAG TPA: hypothetical protein VFX98_17235 [Longimicrobiaceae bacterium]|nr:hypothetical protein [Longimicrobiaceae bacterium]